MYAWIKEMGENHFPLSMWYSGRSIGIEGYRPYERGTWSLNALVLRWSLWGRKVEYLLQIENVIYIAVLVVSSQVTARNRKYLDFV